MILFPAIDILSKNAVRLLHGKFDKVTVYGTPYELALQWQQQGAEYLHVVDLDGAKGDASINAATIKQLIASVNVPVQLGGGIRTLDDMKIRLEEYGASRIIIGTAACLNPDIIEKAVTLFGKEKIVCSIDVKNGEAAIKGWQETTGISAIDLARRAKKSGADYAVFTDISRDGALIGVNTNATIDLAQQSGLKVIASGGVSSLDDLRDLKQRGAYGAILGRAIYNGNFNVSDAINAVK